MTDYLLYWVTESLAYFTYLWLNDELLDSQPYCNIVFL